MRLDVTTKRVITQFLNDCIKLPQRTYVCTRELHAMFSTRVNLNATLLVGRPITAFTLRVYLMSVYLGLIMKMVIHIHWMPSSHHQHY